MLRSFQNVVLGKMMIFLVWVKRKGPQNKGEG